IPVVSCVTLHCPVVLILVGAPLKPAPVSWAPEVPAQAVLLLTFLWLLLLRKTCGTCSNERYSFICGDGFGILMSSQTPNNTSPFFVVEPALDAPLPPLPPDPPHPPLRSEPTHHPEDNCPDDECP